jgi:hypothetical protein
MQASRWAYISVSAELGDQGEVVSINAIKAQANSMQHIIKGINVKR